MIDCIGVDGHQALGTSATAGSHALRIIHSSPLGPGVLEPHLHHALLQADLLAERGALAHGGRLVLLEDGLHHLDLHGGHLRAEALVGGRAGGGLAVRPAGRRGLGRGRAVRLVRLKVADPEFLFSAVVSFHNKEVYYVHSRMSLLFMTLKSNFDNIFM